VHFANWFTQKAVSEVSFYQVFEPIRKIYVLQILAPSLKKLPSKDLVSNLLHYSGKEDVELLLCLSLSNAGAPADAERDDPFVRHELAVLDEPIRIELMRILKLIWSRFYETVLAEIYG
jgi:hypothetical protein